MFLNSWRMRLGLIAAGILLAGTWLICGGGLTPGAETGILIEFGADPDRFAGMDVEVDGRIVGKLERLGQATRTAFALDPGEHDVRIVHPEFNTIPARVSCNTPGIKPMLVLNYADSSGMDGSGRPTLEFQF
jgi:hypothetical protein